MTDAGALPLLVAAGLGLRHALDPDHLVAVGGLAAGGWAPTPGHLVRTGFAWGAGHALSLTLAGLVVILTGWRIAPHGQQLWERLVGVTIALIGLRIVAGMIAARSRPAVPAEAASHRLAPAFGVGAIHGLAGTGGVTLALLPLVPADQRIAAVMLFAAMTCVSMVAGVALLGQVLLRRGPALSPTAVRRGRIGVALLTMLFGVGYAVAA